MRTRTALMAVAMALVASCGDEYRFPDQVPTTGGRHVDAPLRADILSGLQELSDRVEASNDPLTALACSTSENLAVRDAFRQAAHAVGHAVEMGRESPEAATTLSELVARGASKLESASAREPFQCRRGVHPACVSAAAQEATLQFYRLRLQHLPARHQPEFLRLMARDWEFTAERVEGAADLSAGLERVRVACENGEGPVPEFLSRSSRTSPESPENVRDAFRTLFGGEDKLCPALEALHTELLSRYESALHKRATRGLSCDPVDATQADVM